MSFLSDLLPKVLSDPDFCDSVPVLGFVVRKVRELRVAQARNKAEKDRYSQRAVAEHTYALGEPKIGYDRDQYRRFEDGKLPLTPRLNAAFLELLVGYLKCTESEQQDIWHAWICAWLQAMAGQ